MDAIRKLVGERCYLSPCMDGDAEEWTRWLNDLEVAIPLEDEAYTQPTLADQEELARGVKENAYHLFTIVALEDDRRIGRCGLFGVNHANRRASLGISSAREKRPRAGSRPGRLPAPPRLRVQPPEPKQHHGHGSQL